MVVGDRSDTSARDTMLLLKALCDRTRPEERRDGRIGLAEEQGEPWVAIYRRGRPAGPVGHDQEQSSTENGT